MPPARRSTENKPDTEGTRSQAARSRDRSDDPQSSNAGRSVVPAVGTGQCVAEGDTEATTIRPGSPENATIKRQPPDLPAGLRIGAYRVQSVLGEGSMGVVYRAIQDNPNRVVALKVLKPGGSSADSLRRFEQEAQVLGRLQHPGIAQIFEAGTSDAGYGPQPFFAMELIEGVPLTEYAQRPNLSVRERLELMIKVCEGVHHAHQKGVIHRDLKPSNIFVDQRGMPKILDFGVALATVRAAQSDVRSGEEVSPRPKSRLLVGTIPYMSLEQLRGWEAALDTRTDVYALGAITYQLLCGSLPYDLKKKSAEQAIAIVSAGRPTSLGEIDRRFRGEVEILVAKALQPDKDLRYQSVSDFSADIRRFLGNEPISAHPPSTLYQFRKFTQRNQALVVGSLCVFLTLLLAVVGTTIGLWRAKRAEAEATLAQATKEAINDFLVHDILKAADPEQLGPKATIREALDVARKKIQEGALADQPVVRAGVRFILGKTYRALGLYDEADDQLRVALEDYRTQLGGTAAETLAAVNELGLLRTDQGQYVRAETLLKQAWSQRRKQLGETNLDTLESVNGLATLRLRRGDYVDAERLYRQVLQTRANALGKDDRKTLESLSDLAYALFKGNKLGEAESFYRRTLELQRRILGKDHPNTLNTTNNLALLLKTMGRIDEAESYYRRALEGYERVLPREHPTTLSAMNNLAALLKARGALDEAEPLYEHVLEARRRILGDDHPDTLTSMNNLAALLYKQEKLESAESLYRETVERLIRKLGQGHPTTTTAIYALAEVLSKRGKHDEAEVLLRQVLDFIRRNSSQDRSQLSVALIRLGLQLTGGNHPVEAEPLLRECLAIRVAQFPEGDWRIANAQSALGACLTQLRRFDESERLLIASYQALASHGEASHYHEKQACERLVKLYDAWQQTEQAATWRERLAAIPPDP